MAEEKKEKIVSRYEKCFCGLKIRCGDRKRHEAGEQHKNRVKKSLGR